MAGRVPRGVLDNFSIDVIEKAKKLHEGSHLELLRCDARRVLSTDFGSPSVLTRIDRSGDGRVLRTFCSCPQGRPTSHRCEHVLATLLDVLSMPSLSQGFRVPAAARVVVPLCAPHEDAATYREVLGEASDVVEADAEESDDPAPSGPKGALAQGTARVAQPDPLEAFDRQWRYGISRLPGAGRERPATARAVELVYRLHVNRLEERWWNMAVELVVAQEPSSEVPREGDASSAAARIVHPGPTRFNAARGALDRLSAEDRDLTLMILGACDGYRIENGVFRVDRDHGRFLVERLLRSGRCVVADARRWRGGHSSYTVRPASAVPGAMDPQRAARWDDGPPWRPALRLSPHPKVPQVLVELSLVLTRNGAVVPVAEAEALRGDLVIWKDSATLVDCGTSTAWLELDHEALEVPRRSVDELLSHLARRPDLPEVIVDPTLAHELQISSSKEAQAPFLHVTPIEGRTDRLRAAATLRSGVASLPVGGTARSVIDVEKRRIISRDVEIDARAVEDLRSVGLVQKRVHAEGEFTFRPRELPTIVATLGARGWTIEAEDAVLRAPRSMRSSVKWNVDWFDLEGEIDYGEMKIPLAALFEAIRQRRNVVQLGDGSVGIIPQEWMAKFGLLARTGIEQEQGTGTRFAPSSLLLLEAALGTETVDRDEATAKIRQGLRSFSGVAPVDPTGEFVGELRDYQREGLGWMQFLREFGLGGCLADDMGLGKTVQVLAMLEARRFESQGADSPRSGSKRVELSTTPAATRPPSLVVAPRSLIYNWLSEAARFTPKLRMFDLSGTERSLDPASLNEHDVVVTTYGLVRRDIHALREIEFDYVILDEAQAIKNAASQTARAAKLLRARHRLAMSGTPIENHLGELWSLVEFLNPALLAGGAGGSRGAAVSSKRSENGGSKVGPGGAASRPTARALAAADLADPAVAAQAAKAVRPFILRRTKAQVAKQLPERIEKTVVCQLEGVQRKLYDSLRSEVRASVLGKIEKVGMKRSGIAVLEALLRLRQAACHPGLIDTARAGEPSAKLDALIPTLAELASEGHKTLVFSQFTSLLDLVEPRLREEGLRFERLDGSTRDRQACVERFQSDATCPVFLISLKAGGLGLNLTAANHVVLLDPWWNPAVEAQAIDRAHRIGQHQTVIAMRLIAADTVEQRILELQARKRELADAIVGEARGPLASMTREDLEVLLG